MIKKHVRDIPSGEPGIRQCNDPDCVFEVLLFTKNAAQIMVTTGGHRQIISEQSGQRIRECLDCDHWA